MVLHLLLLQNKRLQTLCKLSRKVRRQEEDNSERTGAKPEVPDEENDITEEKDDKDSDDDDEGDDHVSDTQDADDEDVETKSDEDEIFKYKIRVRKEKDVTKQLTQRKDRLQES
ncbi:hypothetical protein Tco_0812967 [Tanacetum coccineum]